MANPTLSEAVLSLRNLRKSFGTFVAVDSTTLDLKRGEILTLLGPSGCGKTTTLRMAIGLERASGGEIVFNGRTVDAPSHKIFVPPEKRDMGMVFQSYAIWPHMNVFQNVAYPLKVRRRPAAEIQHEVMKILELVGLSGFAERPATKLSGGQQQRVAVARGLVFGPDLLLMDEPFSNLDAKLRDQMRNEVKLLQRRLGISVLFVTHDQSEALALSDQVAVMSGGKIVQKGSPFQLYNRPSNAFVRDFLGRNLLLDGIYLGKESGADARVEIDGAKVFSIKGAVHLSSLEQGQPCTISIRPELVEVTREADASGHNSVQGRIATLLFLGDHFEATVELAGGLYVDIRLPPSEEWAENQLVTLHLPAHSVQLWERGQTR